MGDGLYGPLIIHGPSTADYDIDLGPLVLTEWFHHGAFAEFERSGKFGGAPLKPNSVAENGLINGTNTYECSGSTDPACTGTGKRNLVHFEPGKKYLIRLIDGQIDSSFSFSIDDHKLTVIGMDFVPIQPYTTNSVAITSGQRYDIIVEANQEPGNYWMRAIFQTCTGQDNDNKDNIRGIVRYEGAGDADPTTENLPSVVKRCGDEPYKSLIPRVPMDVGPDKEQQSLLLGFFYELSTVFHWSLNTRPLKIDWTQPTNQLIQRNASEYPAEYNVYEVPFKDKVRFSLFVSDDS
jgi:FtsP/CotA-like multicopper oxidase with cupredoxin domain